MAEMSTNGGKFQALTDSVGMALSYRVAVIFVTIVAMPFGLWLGARMVGSMDKMAEALQVINERMVRVETKIEIIQEQQRRVPQ